MYEKFLKILLIIVNSFLILALICIGLFVDYDDHIENGRYTYVRKMTIKTMHMSVQFE